MSSSVHFRFKSAREFETLSFEGDFLKVADLKVAIVERKKLNFGEGFDLEISDASTSDVFNNEDALVQKNTSVIVRRIPGLKQGGILSHQEMAAKNERYSEKQATKPPNSTGSAGDPSPVVPKTIEGSDEAERIASLVMQSNVQYDQFPRPMRGRYSNRSNNRGRTGSFSATRNTQNQAFSANVGHSSSSYPDRAPRPSSNYVCHRCNRPGHWIDQCPTNGDPTYDRIKVRAPTGIPRSMLRQVDAPESGTGLQDSSGHFVTLQPNEEEFARQTVGLRLSQAAASGVDRDQTVNSCSRDRDSSANTGENGASGSGPESFPVADAKTTVPPPSDQSEALKEPAQDVEKHSAGVASETGIGSASRDISNPDSSRGGQAEKKLTTPMEKVRDPLPTSHQSDKSFPSTKLQQPQPPLRAGAPPLPILLPPGFPPLGMPPIPPGMPPLPPHILMAMAMRDGQDGRCPPPLPGMHGNLAMPLSGSALSCVEQQNTGKVTQALKASSQKQKLASDGSDHEVGRVERINRGSKSVSKTRSPSQTREGDENPVHGELGTGSHGVDHQTSEVIDSAFISKHDFPSVQTQDVIRKDTRVRHQSSENEATVGAEFPGSRELESTRQYDSADGNYRKRSPSPPRVRSPLDEDKRRRRGRREKLKGDATRLTHERGELEDSREDPYRRNGRRGRRSSRYDSPEYRESSRYGSVSRDPRHGLYPRRRRSRSPLTRKGHGMYRPPRSESPAWESRSSALGSCFGSPNHRSRGSTSRGWAASVSPSGRFRRERSPDRLYRSKTPPRRPLKYSVASEEDLHSRGRIRDSQRSIPPKREEHHSSGDSPDSDHNRLEADGRAVGKVPELVMEERNKISVRADFQHHPKEVRRRASDAPESPTQRATDDIAPYQARPRKNRLKRERERDLPSGEGDYKRSRREYMEERRNRYIHEFRDRPSVHDRLGRPFESSKKNGQRRSVHDRLG